MSSGGASSRSSSRLACALDSRGEQRLFTATPGGRPRRRQVLAPPADFDGAYESGSSVERLTASPGHVAYVRAGYSELKGKIEGNGRTDESIWLAATGRAPTRLPGPVVTYDRQRDGMVAIGMSPQSPSVSHLAWAARDAPAPRVVPPLPGRLRSLRVAADRAAVLTSAGDGAETALLVDLAGSVRRVAGIEPVDGGLDFDGNRLAWAGEACGAAILHVKDAAEPGVSEDRRTHCAVRVPDPTLRLDQRGRGFVELLCPAPHPARRGDRCAGRMVVRTLSGRRLAQRRFRSRTDESTAPTIRVAGRLLERDRPRRVRLAVTSRTRGHLSRTRRVLRLRVR